jgi:hypothetical protein
MLTPAQALSAMQDHAGQGGGAGAAIAALVSVNNTGYADGSAQRATYLAFEYPYDTPAAANAMGASQSSCGLTVRGAWRAAGVAMDDLYLPYAQCVAAGRYAVASEKAIATQWGAWSDAVTYDPSVGSPDVGDAVIIGCSSCGGTWSEGGGFGGEHEFLVGAIDPSGSPTGPVYWSIDGGQPGIRQCKRVLVRAGSELWMSAVDANGNAPLGAGGRPVAGRRIIGWSRMKDLRFLPDSAGARGPSLLGNVPWGPMVLAATAAAVGVTWLRGRGRR